MYSYSYFRLCFKISKRTYLKQIKEQDTINLIPFFEYVNFKNIELFEFDKIKLEDVDTNKSEDVERFILSHIYYITQK